MTKEPDINAEIPKIELPKSPIDISALVNRARPKVFYRVLSITLGSTAIFGVSGYFLDQHFGTWPAIFIISFIVSFPVSQFILYKSLTKFAKKTLNS